MNDRHKGEPLYYDRVLTKKDVRKVEYYLAVKYGLWSWWMRAYKRVRIALTWPWVERKP